MITRCVVKLPNGVLGGAIFSEDQRYRYALWRKLKDTKLATIMFVMMNPSAATATEDDRTVAKCWGFAQRWGYGRMFIGNTYAYRATDQKVLTEVADPIGPYNIYWLMRMAQECDRVVFAYGKPHPKLRLQGPYVAKRMRRWYPDLDIHVMKLSLDGVPWHPLYLKNDTQSIPWNPA